MSFTSFVFLHLNFAVLFVVPKEAISVSGRADENDGEDKDQATNGAGFPLDKERKQIENHENNMIVQEGWIDWLRDQQHWNQPLQTVHCTVF